jgi:SAM-dependent methyltransferase
MRGPSHGARGVSVGDHSVEVAGVSPGVRRTVSAYQYWDEVWKSTRSAAGWSEPDHWVLEAAAAARKCGAVKALDLGCGVGRHVMQFARMGFQAYGLDRSPHALATTRSKADSEQLSVDLRLGDITALPYDDHEFDYVLAYNVVYHGDEITLARTLAEVARVIRPGRWYQATMLSKRNHEYGCGVEVSRNTFRQPDAQDDKVHEHLYCDFRDLARLHEGFDLISAADVEHSAPGSFHWHAMFEVRPVGDRG